MLLWAITILIACCVVATSIWILYSISPFQNATIALSSAQKKLSFFIMIYPTMYIALFIMCGGLIGVPKIKYHFPSAVAFMSGHILMSFMAVIVSKYMSRQEKPYTILLALNIIASIAYTTMLLVFFHMYIQHNTQ